MIQFRSRTKQKASGFTLVELLTVIVIIGILAGILLPAIWGAVKGANKAAMKVEIEGLSQGMEAYKLKYGDYPPDFSSWPVVQSHYRKIIPDIAITELQLLFRLCDDEGDATAAQTDATVGVYNPSAMDRAEALIWSLGGFSSDPQLPFTGAGGPLALMPTITPSASDATDPAVWQYNSARDNSLMEIKITDLTLVSPDSTVPISFTNRVQSTDDITSATNFVDLFPVYKHEPDGSPYVYFDSRTYAFDAGGGLLNGFATTLDATTDAVRPVLTDRINPNAAVPSASGDTYATIAAPVHGRVTALAAWEFMNPETFQILAPGLDGRFGIVADFDGGTDPMNADPVYWQYPTGTLIRAIATADDPQDLIVPNVVRFGLDNMFNSSTTQVIEGYERDNMASFADSAFEDDVKE